MVAVSGYVHGYATKEQERLVRQAEHWRRLIRDGTQLKPGTRLLEVGCGVGAVLAVLGQEFPGVRLFGVDIEAKQLEFAHGHLERSGVEATLLEADALALPFDDGSFDHIWMMRFLEHVPDPPAALREARRVLAPGGAITTIEVDYSTVRAKPSTPALDALFATVVQSMASAGWSDAGTRLPGWLRDAGLRDIDEGEHPFWWQDEQLAEANYAADVIESALDSLLQVPGAGEAPLCDGLTDLRGLHGQPGAGLGWIVHKSTGRR
jgi:ubiquinone/menaquinone biosynthesis C-methylase UbiE